MTVKVKLLASAKAILLLHLSEARMKDSHSSVLQPIGTFQFAIDGNTFEFAIDTQWVGDLDEGGNESSWHLSVLLKGGKKLEAEGGDLAAYSDDLALYADLEAQIDDLLERLERENRPLAA